MTTRGQATFGDALIFMTKAAVGTVVLISLGAGGLWYWSENNAVRKALETEQELSREALNQADLLNQQISALTMQKVSLEKAIGDLGNLCAAWKQLPPGFVLNLPGDTKPWEYFGRNQGTTP
jgi:hypothetical protein